MHRYIIATLVVLCLFVSASAIEANPQYKQATSAVATASASSTDAAPAQNTDRLICTGSSGSTKLCPLGIFYGQCCSGIDFCCPRSHACNPDGSATCVRKPDATPAAAVVPKPTRPQHHLTVIRNNNQLYDGPKAPKPRGRHGRRPRRGGRGRRSESSESSESSEESSSEASAPPS